MLEIFFSFNFPLCEYFFCTSPAPQHKFSNGPSLTKGFSWDYKISIDALTSK